MSPAHCLPASAGPLAPAWLCAHCSGECPARLPPPIPPGARAERGLRCGGSPWLQRWLSRGHNGRRCPLLHCGKGGPARRAQRGMARLNPCPGLPGQSCGGKVSHLQTPGVVSRFRPSLQQGQEAGPLQPVVTVSAAAPAPSSSRPALDASPLPGARPCPPAAHGTVSAEPQRKGFKAIAGRHGPPPGGADAPWDAPDAEWPGV